MATNQLCASYEARMAVDAVWRLSEATSSNTIQVSSQGSRRPLVGDMEKIRQVFSLKTSKRSKRWWLNAPGCHGPIIDEDFSLNVQLRTATGPHMTDTTKYYEPLNG